MKMATNCVGWKNPCRRPELKLHAYQFVFAPSFVLAGPTRRLREHDGHLELEERKGLENHRQRWLPHVVQA